MLTNVMFNGLIYMIIIIFSFFYSFLVMPDAYLVSGIFFNGGIMKIIFFLFIFILYTCSAYADIIVKVKVGTDEVFEVVVSDDAVVTIEKSPVVETVIIPVNP